MEDRLASPKAPLSANALQLVSLGRVERAEKGLAATFLHHSAGLILRIGNIRTI